MLFGLDLGVDEGGITTLLGANGAGKTTTLRSLSGMCRTDGEIHFDGKPITGRATEDIVRLGIAHVPQGRGTFTRQTVEENLQIGAMTRRDRAAIAADVERVYGYFPRLKERHAPAGRHALGRRAADARGRPRPDAAPAPDAARRAVVRPRAADRARSCSASCARSTQNEKVSMLLVEQNAALALDLADHAYLIETGRLVMAGPAQQLRDDENIRRSYLGY